MHGPRELTKSARCPAHDDQENSLSVTLFNTGKIGMKCHAGCSFEEVRSALGLEPRLFFPPFQAHFKTREGNDVYTYRDKDSNPVLRVGRHPKGRQPKRESWAEHYEDGKWVRGRGDKLRIYNLPEIVAAIGGGLEVAICEGEKDALTAVKMGFAAATTNPFGAGKWRSEFNAWFKDARVVIIPD